jgi:hypothetical protein
MLHRVRVREIDLPSSRPDVWDPEFCFFDDVNIARPIVQSCNIAKWSVRKPTWFERSWRTQATLCASGSLAVASLGEKSVEAIDCPNFRPTILRRL